MLGFTECMALTPWATIPARRGLLGGHHLANLYPPARGGRSSRPRIIITIALASEAPPGEPHFPDRSPFISSSTQSGDQEWKKRFSIPGQDFVREWKKFDTQNEPRGPPRPSSRQPRSTQSRPSIPGKYSKYSTKAESFRALAPPRGGPRPILPSKRSFPVKDFNTLAPQAPPRDVRDFNRLPNPELRDENQVEDDPNNNPLASNFRDEDPDPHWSRKHLVEGAELPRVRPPEIRRKHLELPVPHSPNRLQQGFATRGVPMERRIDRRPRYELPFEFQYTYSEIPKAEPVAERGPNFSPFGPEGMPRPWTGKKPHPPSKKKVKEIDSFNPPPPDMKGVKKVEPAGPFPEGVRPFLAIEREEVMGDPLTPDEIDDLVQACNKENRYVNLGRDGLTHNMLDLIHNHWKRRRVIKFRCKGVPTIDMENLCFHLEDKTGGKIIRRHGGAIYLFRGRNYNPKYRPEIPIMLWKPPVPVYPRLIQKCPEGLTVEQAEYLRRRGRRVKPLMSLSKNGVYMHLAGDVKAAFEVDELVKLDCRALHPNDMRKLGAKLKELLGIVLLAFDNDCILMWRGPPERTEDEKALELFITQSSFEGSKESSETGEEGGPEFKAPPPNPALVRAAEELDNLWDRAIHFGMVTPLQDDQLDPDSIKAIAGTPARVTRPRTIDEEEEEMDRIKLDEERRSEERKILDRRLSAPLPRAAPVGALPVDELAKLLGSPP